MNPTDSKQLLKKELNPDEVSESILELIGDRPFQLLSKQERLLVYDHYSQRSMFYVVEKAKSGQSSCKACRVKLPKGMLRFRHVNCSAKYCCTAKEGDVCGSWHPTCLLKDQETNPSFATGHSHHWKKITSTKQLIHFARLAPEDQDAVAQLFA